MIEAVCDGDNVCRWIGIVGLFILFSMCLAELWRVR